MKYKYYTHVKYRVKQDCSNKSFMFNKLKRTTAISKKAQFKYPMVKIN